MYNWVVAVCDHTHTTYGLSVKRLVRAISGTSSEHSNRRFIACGHRRIVSRAPRLVRCAVVEVIVVEVFVVVVVWVVVVVVIGRVVGTRVFCVAAQHLLGLVLPQLLVSLHL